jgi:putative flippase GtrA
MRPDNHRYLLLMKFMNKEFFKFLAVGGFNTASTYILYLVAILFIPYQIAYILSYCFGLFLVSVLNVKFVFNKNIGLKNSIKTICVYIIQLALGFILITVCVRYLEIDKKIAPLIIIIALLPFTFLANKFVLSNEESINT